MMKILNFILPAFLFMLYQYSLATDYYSVEGQTDPTVLANWNTDSGGTTGASPTDFNGNDDFIIQTGHAYIAAADWTIAGDLGDETDPLSTGSLTINGGVTVDISQDINGSIDVILADNAILKVGKNYQSTGILTTGTGSTVVYSTNGTSGRDVKPGTYYHLIIDKSGSVNADFKPGEFTINGDLTVETGILNSSNDAIITINGKTTIKTGGGLDNVGGADFTFANDLEVNGSFIGSHGTYTFSGTDNSIGGSTSPATFDKMIIDGNYTNSINRLKILDDLTGVGTLTNSENNTIEIGDDAEIANLIATAASNTVKYNGTGGQAVKAVDYYHLVIEKQVDTDADLTGTINVGGDFTILSGDLDVRSGSTVNVTGTTTVNTGGLIQFADASGDVNLYQLNMTGGQLGHHAAGSIDCTSMNITGTTNTINLCNFTVDGPTTVDGTVDFTASQGSRTFNGDVTVNGVWNNTGQADILITADVFVNGAFNCQTGTTTISSGTK